MRYLVRARSRRIHKMLIDGRLKPQPASCQQQPGPRIGFHDVRRGPPRVHWPFNTLHRHKWGYAHFDGLSRRVLSEGTGRRANRRGELRATWFICLRRPCLQPTFDGRERGAQLFGVNLFRHTLSLVS